MSNIALIIVETDGVEFYTDAAGKSGISQTGLAKLCGVNKSSISRLMKEIKTPSNERNKNPSHL